MSRLYSNENFPLAVVEELRRLGHDVLTSQDAGNASQSIPDDSVLQFAIGDQRAVLTLNRRHFMQLHRKVPAHSGIIVCTFDPNFPAQAARIDSAISGKADLNGLLLRVNRPG